MCLKICPESWPCHYYHRCSYSDQRITPHSEDEGISYLDIAKIEKETQCRLCSSPSQVSGRGAVGKQTPVSKKKNVPSRSQNAGNDMVFHDFLAMKMFGRGGDSVTSQDDLIKVPQPFMEPSSPHAASQ